MYVVCSQPFLVEMHVTVNTAVNTMAAAVLSSPQLWLFVKAQSTIRTNSLSCFFLLKNSTNVLVLKEDKYKTDLLTDQLHIHTCVGINIPLILCLKLEHKTLSLLLFLIYITVLLLVIFIVFMFCLVSSTFFNSVHLRDGISVWHLNRATVPGFIQSPSYHNPGTKQCCTRITFSVGL